MRQYCDLHVHSTCSDGTCTPTELVQMAEDLGLSAVALCDHNTVAGLPEFLAAGEGKQVKTVPGVEFSTEYGETELHILALWLDRAQFGKVTALLEDFRQRKDRSNAELVENLNRAGFRLDYAAICQAAGGYVNRAHIAAAMTKAGYTETNQEAFKKYLAPEAGFYTPPQRLDAFDAIRFIKSLGAVAVLAHPYLNLEQPALEQFLPRAVEAGLDAMEVLYPKYDGATRALAAETAERFGLLPSGGSDFHGENKPDIAMGTGRGDLKIPAAFEQGLHNLIL